jgi:hypothetical protein
MEPVDPFWFQVAVREDLGNIEALYEPKKGWAWLSDPNQDQKRADLVTHENIKNFLDQIYGRELKTSRRA